MNNGQLAVNGSLLTQVGGVNTVTYSDSGLTTPLPNPIPLNSRGEISDATGNSKQLFLTPNTVYTFTLFDGPNGTGNQIWVATYVNGVQQTLTQSGIGAVYRPTLSWETGVVNNFWDYGDLRRFGCDITGATDNSANITNAITSAVAAGGNGFIYHPGGTIAHTLQITIPNNLSIVGLNRAASIFKFTGTPSGSPAATRSAWRYTGVAPWSGYANVFIRDVQFQYQNTVNFAACLEISAWGWAYFDIDRVWCKGSCSYGIILDGAEICSVNKCLIENINATANANIWIVNGADRGFGQGTGFSNVITIRENQISSNSAVSVGLQDDGGNAHVVQGNNFNGHRIPATFAGCTALRTGGNSYETPQTAGAGNLIFSAVTAAGNPVGPCSGCQLSGDGYFGGISSDALLVFTGTLNTVTNITKATSAVVTVSTGGSANPFIVGAPLYLSGVSGMTQINGQAGYVTAIGGSSGAWTATVSINSSGFSSYTSGGQAQMMHSGIMVSGNVFGSQSGRGSAIDVTFLANSWCFANTDEGITSGMSHYANAHNDNNGNVLMPPNNGFSGGLGIGTAGALFGDARYPFIFANAVGSNGATPPAQVTGWGTPTGAAVVANYPGATATLVQTSNVVAEIIAYLKSKGDFGA